jgi:hypothetical protein
MPDYGAERLVWNEKMLAALHERRVKGNKWFSLIDKVTRLDVLEGAWAKVRSNAGPAAWMASRWSSSEKTAKRACSSCKST